MKKILEIYTFSESGIGGVSTMVKSYMNSVTEFANSGCSLELLNVTPIINFGHPTLNNFAYIFTQRNKVAEHLKTHHYDVVHIHTSREFLFLKDVLLAKMINKRFHIPVVMTIHVGAMQTVFNRIGWFKQKALSIMNNYISKTIFLSKVMQDEFFASGLKSNRSTVLYNFHNLTPTDCSSQKDSKALQLLFVGMLNRDKGIVELLTALSQIPNFDCHLHICGKLVDRSIEGEIESLKTKLGDKVSFLGYVVGEDKTKLFQNSDVLILPSYHEGLPIVIMEALAAGCAIMSTKVGAIPEVLNDTNCKWLDIASSNSIVSQLLDLTLVDLELMKRNNKLLGNLYSLDTHIRKLATIYNNIIE